MEGLTVMTVSVTGETVASTALTAWAPTYPAYLSDLTQTPASSGCACQTGFGDCAGRRCRSKNRARRSKRRARRRRLDNEGEEGGDGGDGGDLTCINGNLFDESVYLHTVAFGSVVERTLTDIDEHPYHQHVYPFQIVATNGIENADHAAFYQIGDWHDVVQMDTEGIIMRYNADVHTGVLMLHCHILPHEDEGTMSQELVIESGGQCSCDSNFVQQPDLAIPAVPTPATEPTPAAPGPAPAPTAPSGTTLAVEVTDTSNADSFKSFLLPLLCAISTMVVFW